MNPKGSKCVFRHDDVLTYSAILDTNQEHLFSEDCLYYFLLHLIDAKDAGFGSEYYTDAPGYH